MAYSLQDFRDAQDIICGECAYLKAGIEDSGMICDSCMVRLTDRIWWAQEQGDSAEYAHALNAIQVRGRKAVCKNMGPGWAWVAMTDFTDNQDAYHLAYLAEETGDDGFEMPYFTKHEVERMNNWLKEYGDSLAYDEVRDEFVTTADSSLQEHFKGVDINGHHLYPIGAYTWLWERV